MKRDRMGERETRESETGYERKRNIEPGGEGGGGEEEKGGEE